MQEIQVQSLGWQPTPVFLNFPCGSAGKESAHKVGDLRSILGLGRSPGEGKGYPLQYSGLENSMKSPWGCKGSDTTERLSLSLFRASLIAQLVKNLLARQETLVLFLGQEDLLEKA